MEKDKKWCTMNIYVMYIGFTSEEEQGVYQCPKCGNQMRIAKTGIYGDSSPVVGRWLLTII